MTCELCSRTLTHTSLLDSEYLGFACVLSGIISFSMLSFLEFLCRAHMAFIFGKKLGGMLARMRAGVCARHFGACDVGIAQQPLLLFFCTNSRLKAFEKSNGTHLDGHLSHSAYWEPPAARNSKSNHRQAVMQAYGSIWAVETRHVLL